MLKIVTFVRFAEGASRNAQRSRWREELGPMYEDVPGLLRYVQNHLVGTATNEGLSDEEPPYDGYSTTWWDGRDAFEAAIRGGHLDEIRKLAGEVFDLGWVERGMSAAIEERVKRVGLGSGPGPAATPPGDVLKLVGLLRYRSDMTREEANRYWTIHHGDLALRLREMGHYVQNHAVEPVAELTSSPSDALGFDGFSEAWFEGEEAYRRTMESPEWQSLVDDGPNLFDMAAFKGAIIQEHVLRESD